MHKKYPHAITFPYFCSFPKDEKLNIRDAEELSKNLLRFDHWKHYEVAERMKNEREDCDPKVWCLDPQTVWIDKRAIISEGVYFFPFSSVRGVSWIGKNVVVDQGSVIDWSYIGNNVEIGIGNIFRRTHVGERCKIPYNAELIDIVIGEETNIARGVTISNFDGIEKQKTIIGARCFIGTDVNIVPEIEIGDEVRIYPKLLVASKTLIPSHAWILPKCENGRHGITIRENSSFKIPGHWRWIWTREPMPNTEKMRALLSFIGSTFADTEGMVKFLTKKRNEIGGISLCDILQAPQEALSGKKAYAGPRRFDAFERALAKLFRRAEIEFTAMTLRS